MKTFTLTAAIDADGHLHLDVPTQLAPGQVELVLVIQSNCTGYKPIQAL